MGISVRKVEDPSITTPTIELRYLNSVFKFSGEPIQQAQVMSWALSIVQCAKDVVEEVSASQTNILTRYLTSFSIIYSYTIPKAKALQATLDQTKDLCLKSGNTLIFKVSQCFAYNIYYHCNIRLMEI